MPNPLAPPSIVSPIAVEPSIRRLFVLAPSWPAAPGLSGGRILFPNEMVLLAGRPKLIVTDCPVRFSAFA